MAGKLKKKPALNEAGFFMQTDKIRATKLMDVSYLAYGPKYSAVYLPISHKKPATRAVSNHLIIVIM